MLLEDLQKKHKADKLDSDIAMHFLNVYERWFEPIRLNKMEVLEIGIHHGGSLKMWEEYFPNSQITGIDVDKKCKKHEAGRIKVFIGDQADIAFLQTMGRFNIIIDDGGHKMDQQKNSFYELWNHLNHNGMYVLEDLETSYWPKFDGVYRNKNTTIEMLKGLVDNVNCVGAAHPRSEHKKKIVEDLNIEAIHFYQSLCLIHKKA